LRGLYFDILGEELTAFAVFNVESVGGGVRQVSVVVEGVKMTQGLAIFLEATTVESGDGAAKTDVIGAKMGAGWFVWVPISSVGVAGHVWVLISKVGGCGSCRWPKFSVWVPIDSRMATTVLGNSFPSIDIFPSSKHFLYPLPRPFSSPIL